MALHMLDRTGSHSTCLANKPSVAVWENLYGVFFCVAQSSASRSWNLSCFWRVKSSTIFSGEDKIALAL